MSQNQMRREKCSNSKNKDTRWDRIRKRHTIGGNSSISTDAVRRFIDMDYVGKHNERLLQGDKDARTHLNPLLVMNLRHQMFQKIPKKLPLATIGHRKNLDSCIVHNMMVEEHYIDNELAKFRNQLEKNRKRKKVKLRVEHSLRVDNTELMQSLEAAAKHVQHFYTVPIEALQEVYTSCAIKANSIENEFEKNNTKNADTFEDNLNLLKEKIGGGDFKEENSVLDHEKDIAAKIEREGNEYSEPTNFIMRMADNLVFPEQDGNSAYSDDREVLTWRRTPSPLALTDEIVKPIREAAERHQQELQQKLERGGVHVHFEDAVEVRKYQRENSSCSNTSEGIDSVISDLAEEALMELQMEEQAKAAASVEQCEIALEKVEDAEDQVVNNGIYGETIGSKGDAKELLIIRSLALPDFCNKNKKEEDIVLSTDDEEETVSNNEQNLIIEQLFKSRTQTNVVVTMRKYLYKWIHYTTIEKIERENFSSKTDRITKINAFLDNIRREKVRLTKYRKAETHEMGEINNPNYDRKQPPGAAAPGTVQIAKKYQTKIKVQQDIIDLQRLKLERQERLIMELKLNKLSEESKEARQEIKNELKAVIRSGDPKSKAKAKCLQLIGNLRDANDDELNRLYGKALIMPKCLQKMQERALERSVRHEQARARRLQHEAEREAQKAAAEEAKRQEDEEAKRMRIEVLREKRRQEKMAKVLKERERQRAIENMRKSQDFYRRLLLRRVGFEGFKRLLQRKHENQRKCEAFRRQIFKRTYFIAWKNYYVLMCQRKIMRANDFYCKIIKRNTMAIWLLYVQNERSKYLVAVDWHELKLSESVFLRWSGYTRRMQMIECTKMRQATSHHEWHLKWKVLDCWQRLPQILQLEKETEERRQRWRMKIWELLPDYTPNRDEFLLN